MFKWASGSWLCEFLPFSTIFKLCKKILIPVIWSVYKYSQRNKGKVLKIIRIEASRNGSMAIFYWLSGGRQVKLALTQTHKLLSNKTTLANIKWQRQLRPPHTGPRMRVASLRVTGLRVFYSFMEWEHHSFILTPRMLWSRYTFRKLRNVSIAAQRTNNRHQQNTSKLAALAARKTESWLKVNFWNATRGGSQVKSSQSPRWMAVWVTPRRVYSLTLKKPANSQTRNPHARSSVGRPLVSVHLLWHGALNLGEVALNLVLFAKYCCITCILKKC